ncbi:hypothetical protein ACTPEF_24895, partial [Clostridioides difficile]
MVKGMLVYSGGGSLGKPFIHLGHVHSIEGPELQDEKAIIFGEYMKLGDLMSMFSLNAGDSQSMGRRIFRRPYLFMRHRARRMEH